MRNEVIIQIINVSQDDYLFVSLFSKKIPYLLPVFLEYPNVQSLQKILAETNINPSHPELTKYIRYMYQA